MWRYIVGNALVRCASVGNALVRCAMSIRTIDSTSALVRCVIFITAIFLILTGCVPKYLPVVQGNIEILDEFAILRTDDEMLAVRMDLWNGEPQYLTEYFDVMFIRVQNRTRENIKIETEHFALIDENSLQSDLVPADIVLEIALAHPSLVPEWYSISAETQRENLTRINTIRRNIMTRAFAFGDIYPGAIKEGMIFFPKLESKNQEFTLIYKSNEIVFRKMKK